jgi:Bacterial HORMA domain family 1
MTYSLTLSASFTITDARHVASKVGADLRNLNSVYGAPALGSIDDFVEEVAQLLKAEYLNTVDYGFKSNDGWKLRLRYTATIGGQLRDDTPGRLPYDALVNGLPFYSYLRYNSAFQALDSAEQRVFEATLPVERSGAEEPGLGVGSYGTSASYARNGQGVGREVWSSIT